MLWILKQKWAVQEHSGKGRGRRAQQLLPEKSVVRFCYFAKIQPSAVRAENLVFCLYMLSVGRGRHTSETGRE